jgi:acetyl esterase/lipase
MGRHIITSAWWFGLIALSLCLVNPAAAQVDQQRAEAYFKEAATICQRDGGRLWGVSLCGPMVFVDARTRTVATNQPRPTADMPRVLGFANAPVEWGGSRWAGYIWDFTTSLDPRSRAEFMLHELFHRIQPDLGLITLSGQNAHLDTIEGRIWLRLEWRALARALGQSGEDRKRALSDAAAFRLKRRSQFANAAESERVEEIREGLAQYTGIVATAATRPEAVASTIGHLAGAEAHETFLQQSYTTGTAYAVLLDDASPDWRRRVRSDSDLGQMLMAALEFRPAADAVEASARYGGAEIRAAEKTRDEQHRTRILELRNRFVDSPGLLVPSGGGGTFNAVGATPIPGVGTVFVLPYRQRGDWGTLEATKGVLVNEDGTRRLPGPVRIEGANVTGDGWTVTVAPGWTVREGARRGVYEVVPRGIGAVPAPVRQPSVTRDVVYGHKDGLALTFDVHRPAQPNGAGVIAIVSGGWQSSVEMSRAIVDDYLSPLLNKKGFTVFAVRHGSSPRYPMSAIVADMRRSVRFIRQHAGEYGVEPNRIGVYGGSAGGQLALLLGTTADSGDPSATDAVLRESSRVAAVVAFFPPTDLSRFGTERIRRAFAAMRLTDAEAAEYSPIRFVSPGAAPSLIVHGDADTSVPIVEGETMHAALAKAGASASFIRIEGAGHGFASADLERVNAAMVQWFEQHLRGAAK